MPIQSFANFERWLADFTNYERLKQVRYDPEAIPLERTRSLAAAAGDPHRRYPVVHITGTKGKGATTLLLEALLRAEGLRVGTYTSPHVEHLRERIRVHGAPLGEQEFVELANSFLPVLEDRRRAGAFPTFFELMTVMAMTAFARNEVDIALFEVGLGGRLDATNIVEPEVTAITSVGLEHTRILGDTLEAIAAEKAGILKAGVPAVLGDLLPPAHRVIQARAVELGCPVDRAPPTEVRPAGPGRLELDGLPGIFEAPAVVGPALRADLAVALGLHRRVLAARGRPRDPARIAQGVARARLPARLELLDGTPPVVLDGAHTEDSFTALRDALEELELPRPRVALLSLAADKRRGPILRALRNLADDVVITRADPVRSVDPELLRKELGGGQVIDEPAAALSTVLALDRPVVICGSIYLAGAVRPLLVAPAPRPLPARQ